MGELQERGRLNMSYVSNQCLHIFGIYKDMKTKTCIYCNEEKDIGEFPKHIHYHDNLDSRCKKCIKEHSAIRRRLLKTAPPKPTHCECCGTIPRKWCMDHDHDTEKFRGWLCDPCNTGIGKLGDNIEGLERALDYLHRTTGKQ